MALLLLVALLASAEEAPVVEVSTPTVEVSTESAVSVSTEVATSTVTVAPEPPPRPETQPELVQRQAAERAALDAALKSEREALEVEIKPLPYEKRTAFRDKFADSKKQRLEELRQKHLAEKAAFRKK